MLGQTPQTDKGPLLEGCFRRPLEAFEPTTERFRAHPRTTCSGRHRYEFHVGSADCTQRRQPGSTPLNRPAPGTAVCYFLNGGHGFSLGYPAKQGKSGRKIMTEPWNTP